jgi:hypothetical protein
VTAARDNKAAKTIDHDAGEEEVLQKSPEQTEANKGS